MGVITIFFKNGRVVGSCPVGSEESWKQHKKENKKIDYDTTKESTDYQWKQWAKKRITESEADAQSVL